MGGLALSYIVSLGAACSCLCPLRPMWARGPLLTGVFVTSASVLDNISDPTLSWQVLTPEVARPDVRTVVVVITDGESDSRKNTAVQARRLREQNVRLVWLYIGENLRFESRSMKKEGDAIFKIDNFGGLGDELELQILGASCKEDETTPASNMTEIPATTSRTTMPAPATTSTATPAPPATTSTTTTAPITTTTTLTSTAATAGTTEQQDTTTTLPHTELASSTTGLVLIESSTLYEAPAAVSFSKETTVTQSLTTQETPINPNTTLAPVVSTPSVAATESTAQIHAQATDANATQNRTDKPEADHSVPAVTAGDQVSERESAHRTYDGSTNQGSWQQDWMMSAGISAGVVALVGVASGLGYVALRRWKQRRNKAGHDL